MYPSMKTMFKICLVYLTRSHISLMLRVFFWFIFQFTNFLLSIFYLPLNISIELSNFSCHFSLLNFPLFMFKSYYLLKFSILPFIFIMFVKFLSDNFSIWISSKSVSVVLFLLIFRNLCLSPGIASDCLLNSRYQNLKK